VIYIIQITTSEKGERRTLNGLVYSLKELSTLDSCRVEDFKAMINKFLDDKIAGFGIKSSSVTSIEHPNVVVHPTTNIPSEIFVQTTMALFPVVVQRLNIREHAKESKSIVSLLKNASEDPEFKNRIAYELAAGKSTNLEDMILALVPTKPNISYVRLVSTEAVAHVGGGSLDMSAETLPILQWFIYHAVKDYDIAAINWIGNAGGSESLQTLGKLSALGGPVADLLFTTQEIQYCTELGTNIERYFRHLNPDDISSKSTNLVSLSKFPAITCCIIILGFHLSIINLCVENYFCMVGVNYEDTRMSQKVDTSRVAIFTSAILDPNSMLVILIKAIREGHRFFIVPKRNIEKDGALSKIVLNELVLKDFSCIPMKLGFSGYALPLISFVLDNDDALSLTK
jgi:hypothetical protein